MPGSGCLQKIKAAIFYKQQEIEEIRDEEIYRTVQVIKYQAEKYANCANLLYRLSLG